MMHRQNGPRQKTLQWPELQAAAMVVMMLASGATSAQSAGTETASPRARPAVTTPSAPPAADAAPVPSPPNASPPNASPPNVAPKVAPSPLVVTVFALDEGQAELNDALAQAFERAGAGVVRGAQKTPQQRFGAVCGRDAACRTGSFSVYPADAGLFGEVWTDETGASPQRALTVVFAQARSVLWEATFLAPNEAALVGEADFIAQRAFAALAQEREAEGARVAAAEETTVERAEPPLDDDEMEDEVAEEVAEEGTRIWPEDASSEKHAESESSPGAEKFAQAPAAPVVEPDEGSAGLFWSWIGGFVAIGAAMAGTGVLFDLFSPTSANDAIDVGDAVGPALVIAGAAFAVIGVLFNPFSLPEEGAS